METRPLRRRLQVLCTALQQRGAASASPAGAAAAAASIYDQLGIATIINANGPSTRLSGGIPRPEVVQAMAEAASSCVDIGLLQGRASEIISEVTGAEAGYVTAGAACGLLLGTAACITGPDPVKMNALPDLTGLKSEVVVARNHRNFYDKAVRAVGVKLVEVGLSDRNAGAGVRDGMCCEFSVKQMGVFPTLRISIEMAAFSIEIGT